MKHCPTCGHRFRKRGRTKACNADDRAKDDRRKPAPWREIPFWRERWKTMFGK